MEALICPRSASDLYASELACREVDEIHKVFEETPWLLPKHKIFISHSGAQKDFAEQLCVDLERDGYYPFFDRREDSLPKGKRFPELIFKAARECLLAIVLLSKEFFTRSKWPILELAAFTQARKSRNDLRILPVLLGLTIEDLKSTAKWSGTWTEWGKQDCLLNDDVIRELDAAVIALRHVSMILKSKFDGEVALRKGIVCSIIQTMPPDVRSDVVHVQGRERLCKELRSKFDKLPSTSHLCQNAKLLGVYGIGGAGKSTMCVIMTQFLRSEFLGRVCHVEFGAGTSIVDLQRKVLRRLFRVTEDFLNMHISTKDEGLSCLRERMSGEPVFLALDNVSDDDASLSNANLFLRLKFHRDSMVLVTSRSGDVLQSSLGIPESSCMHCPSITSEEGRHILLEQVNLPIERLNWEQRQVLHQTVERCCIDGYHPLAIKLFAAQLGTNPSTWRESNIPLTPARVLSLLSAIETSYTELREQDIKDMFMDIALFTPEGLCTVHEISRWLSDTIYLDRYDVDYIKRKLSILREKYLLEVWKMDDETVRIHEFYHMLVEREADVVSKFIYQRGGVAAPKALPENDQARIVERAAFVETCFEMLGLEACTKLKVLSIRRCQKLTKLCIQRLGCLVSLELSVCPLESMDLSNLSSMRWLHVSACEKLMELDASDAKSLGYVNVSKCRNLRELNLKNCHMVRSLSILYSDSLHHVNVGSGQNLECLTLWFCRSLTHVEMSGVAYVNTLKKKGCPRLLNMQGGDIMCKDLEYMYLELWGKLSPTFIRALETSASLQVLDLWHSPISRLPDLRDCVYLRELRFSHVDVLLDSSNEELLHEYDVILHISAHDLDLPISLEDIRIESCRNVVVKEVFLKLQGLKNLRVLSLQEVRVGWDWELFRSIDGSMSPDRMDIVSGEASGALCETHRWVENEDDDEEVSMLRNQIDVMHGQLSTMGMNQQCYPSDNCSGEVHDAIGITSYLTEIMHWIQVFANGKRNFSELEQSVKAELQLHWKASAEPINSQHEQLEELFWSNMSKAAEIKGSPCWVVEQIIDRACSNCDALCEILLQVLCIDKVSYATELCLKAHVEEINCQLFFLTAKHPIHILMEDLYGWETWERMIIKEVVLKRQTPICKTRFWEKGTLVIPRLEILVKRLATLSMCRGWMVDCRVESDKQELEQYAWGWLWACRVCLSIEQLKCYLAKQYSSLEKATEVRYGLGLLHLQELQKLLDAKFKVELNKLREDALASDEGCGFKSGDRNDDCDRFGGLIRCWKIRQWLEELESCLSEGSMQDREAPAAWKENISVVDEMCQSISEIKEQFQFTRLVRTISKQTGTAGAAVVGGWAERLISRVRRERPETEHLYSLLGVASKDNKLRGVEGKGKSAKLFGHLSIKERAKVMAWKKTGILVGSSSKEPGIMGEGEVLELSQRGMRFPLIKIWDDVNTEEVVSLPFSQCSGLRHIRISNCRLKNPRGQLGGQWECRVADRFGKSREYNHHSQVTLGVMYFHRLDCPSAALGSETTGADE